MLESLESRRLMSVTTDFTSGVLTITSDDASDRVSLSTNAHGQIVVAANHHVIRAIGASHVTSILVNLGGGNDVLETAHTINKRMTVHGGEGNDAIQGGSAHDQLFGDGGDDVIRAQDGVSDTVNGGPGNDTAYTDANDTLSDVEHVVHPQHHHPHHHFHA